MSEIRKAITKVPYIQTWEETMSRFNISKARKERIKRAAIKILKEPKAIMAIGALILAIGMYTGMQTAPYPALTFICGGVGLAIGIGEFRKMKAERSKMKPKHIYVLIALGAMFSAFGFFRMWNDVPVQTFIALSGALILGGGFTQLKIRRIASNAMRNLLGGSK